MTARFSSWAKRAGGISLAAFLPLASAAPAAAEISEDVRRDIEALVEDLTGASSLSALEFGQIDIAAEGDGYRVTVAEAQLLPGHGVRLDLGDVVLALVPTEDGYRITGAELAEAMEIYGPDGVVAGTVHIGKFDLTGAWQRSISTLSEVDVTIGELALAAATVEAEPGPGLTISEIVLNSRVVPDGDGTWREDMRGELKEFAVEDGPSGFSISSITFSGVSEGVDLDALAELRQLMIDATESASLAEDGVADPELLGSIRERPHTMRGYRADMSLNGLQVLQPYDEPVTVRRVILSQNFEGLDGALARGEFQLGIADLDVPSAGAMAGLENDLAPQSLELNLAVEELPWPAVWEFIVDAMYAAAPGDEAGWRLGLALQEAGTRLLLNPSQLSSAPLVVSGGGELQADPAAAFGAVAAFAFEIAGLAEAQSLAGESPYGGEAVAILAQIEAMGAADVDGDGETVRRYEIVLDADGMLTVNGEPFSFDPESGIEN